MDHEVVSNYPPVIGMRKRLFWLDHREPEGGVDQAQPFQTSHWNNWEIETVAAVVTHLVRQGVYKSEEIAVLTPYVRQLQKIKYLLGASFEIVVGDRDEEELEKQEAAMVTRSSEDRLNLKSASTLTSTRVTLSQRLRLATVDNFQGEEANVIIVSLVRSNGDKACGFLRTTNRINVLLSVAQPATQIYPAVINARGFVDRADPEMGMVYCKLVTAPVLRHVGGPTLAAIMHAQPSVMGKIHAPYVPKNVRSLAAIRGVAKTVESLVLLVQKLALLVAITKDNVNYHVLYHAVSYPAPTAAVRYLLVDINARHFVESGVLL
ncbi:MAG: hypothetical protein Q9187_008575 [Circinaria calcarea]